MRLKADVWPYSFLDLNFSSKALTIPESQKIIRCIQSMPNVKGIRYRGWLAQLPLLALASNLEYLELRRPRSDIVPILRGAASLKLDTLAISYCQTSAERLFPLCQDTSPLLRDNLAGLPVPIHRRVANVRRLLLRTEYISSCLANRAGDDGVSLTQAGFEVDPPLPALPGLAGETGPYVVTSYDRDGAEDWSFSGNFHDVLEHMQLNNRPAAMSLTGQFAATNILSDITQETFPVLTTLVLDTSLPDGAKKHAASSRYLPAYRGWQTLCLVCPPCGRIQLRKGFTDLRLRHSRLS